MRLSFDALDVEVEADALGPAAEATSSGTALPERVAAVTGGGAEGVAAPAAGADERAEGADLGVYEAKRRSPWLRVELGVSARNPGQEREDGPAH